MKDTTQKLSGPAKDRFLERFFAEEPELATEIAARLAARSKATFSSVRVRKLALAGVLRRGAGSASKQRGRKTKPVMGTAPAPPVIEQPQEAPPTGAFDPYVFGLVPLFQREGREGLIAKLAEIDDVDHLRQMAKSQQVVLPRELRSGEAEPDAVRIGIADAVAKRIADRRAAAG